MNEREIVATVTLSRPIRQGEQVIDKLEFTEPDLTALDAMERAAKTSNMAGTAKLIESLANVPPSVAYSIKALDMVKIMAALAPFLPSDALDMSGVEAGE